MRRRFRGEIGREKCEVVESGGKAKAEEEAWCAWEWRMEDATVHCVSVAMAFI